MSEAPPASTDHSQTDSQWLRGFAILTAGFGVAWLLAVFLDMPWLASWTTAATVGWVLIRVARANARGVVFWWLALVALSTSVRALLHGTEFGWVVCSAVAGLVLTVIACLVFLVAAVRDRTRRGRNCACFNLALFTLVFWMISAGDIGSRLHYLKEVRHTTKVLTSLHALGTEIESLQARLGRLPKDEEELVALRGKPLPAFYKEYRIHYQRQDGDQYRLECSLSDFWGHAWDGWIVFYNGPDSLRPLQVTLF